MLRKIRTVLAVIFFMLITLLFLDITGALHLWLGWLAKIQFLPAVLSMNFIVVAILAVITLIFGRIYCSVICPLGILQDIISRLRSKFKKKSHYGFSKEKKWLRYGFLAIFALALILGFQAFAALLAPYSSYGRIVENLLSPIYRWGNNLFAMIAERAGSYAFYSKEVWLKSLPVFIVSVISLVVIAILAWRGGRTYCNTVCPVGTTLSFLSRFSAFRPVIDEEKCKHCRKCEKNCKASCIDLKHLKVDYSRCVTCFNCVNSCKYDAMKYRFAWKPAKSDKAAGEKGEDGAVMSKRAFLTTSAMVMTAAAARAQEKKTDGGLAEIIVKKAPKRTTPLTPFGSNSVKDFYSHCTACQLCVATCPNQVLRPSGELSHFMQPEMSYERGYCRPECVKCSEVCPAGAIKRITPEEKTAIHIGIAEVDYSLCVVNRDNVKCGNCARHCPAGAIRMVKKNGATSNNEEKPLRIPAVIEDRCIGCGACEFVCPSRPLSAIKVNGREVHVNN